MTIFSVFMQFGLQLSGVAGSAVWWTRNVASENPDEKINRYKLETRKYNNYL